jgi:protein AroM
LITLLNDRTSVIIAKRCILDRLQAQITDLEENENVAATLLMCTGEFPQFEHRKPLLQPQASLYGVVAGTVGDGRVGALIPIEAQYTQARQKWVDFGLPNAVVADANPYCDDPISAVQAAAAKVRDEGASVLFMDCFGYDNGMRAAAQESFGGPVILARSMAARIVSELIA